MIPWLLACTGVQGPVPEPASVDAPAPPPTGPPPLPDGIALAEVPGASPAPDIAWTFVAEPVAAPPTWGPRGWWGFAVDAPAAGLALDGDVPVGTVRRLLAAHAPAGEPLLFLVAADGGRGAIALALPDGSAAQRVAFTRGARLVVPASGDVRVAVADDVPFAELAAALGPAKGRRVELALDAAPCLDNAGLRCLPGDGAAPTLYVDAAPVDLAAAEPGCRKAEVCQSAVGTWAAARELCSYRGLRLPTAWEATRAGWATEPGWTATWDGGDPPTGACDGAPRCRTTTKRRLTDGTAASPKTVRKDAPVRCVTSEPWAATWPPSVVSHPRPTRPPPSPPTEAELAAAWGVTGDVLDDKGICSDEVRKDWHESIRAGGRSTTECRDPYTYVTTNEPERYLFGRFVANAGGIYVGVGSDQSYDFVAAQRPDWAFLYDYDPNVIRFHRITQAFLRHAATRQELVDLWGADHTDDAEKWIAEEWPDEAAVLQTFFHGFHRRIHASLKDGLTPMAAAPTFGFLATDENYAVVHTLAVQRRVVPVPVDLLETVGLRSIGAAARALGQPVRVFYTSNAPVAWGGNLTPEYRENVRSLPMDPRSVAIATFNWGAWHQTGRWRYDIMHGPLLQERLGLSGYADANEPGWDRIPGDDGNLTVVALPAAWPDGAP